MTRNIRYLSAGLLAALLSVSSSGCQILGGDDNDLDDLAIQRRIWEAENSGNYAFNLQRGCFCIYAGIFEIHVQEYAVVDVIPAWDDQIGVPPEDYRFFWTIDELFDLIRDAQAGGADEIEVTYSVEGYPVSIDIDYIEQAIDDELFLRVEDLRMQ